MSESEKDRNAKGRGGKPPEKKHRGFYAALYSCVGLMLTLAVVIGYRNFMMDEPSAMTDPDYYSAVGQEGHAVSNSNEKPGSYGYLTPEDRSAQGDIGEPLMESNDVARVIVETPANTPATTDAPDAATVTDAPSVPSANPTDMQDSQMSPTTLNNEKNMLLGMPQNTGDVTEMPEATDTTGITDATDMMYGTDTAAYRMFSENDRMAWPVTGEIVMAYSMDHVIYDRTLDQYRTNDSIAIAAPLGTEVRAAATGIVLEITSSRESGKTVVVDHGNGWTTTYSQLQGNVPVEVGSVVREGQIVGGVGEPSLYSVLLGPHLQFAVARDGAPMNPGDILVRD